MKKILLLSTLIAHSVQLLGMEDDLKGRMEKLPTDIKSYISGLVGSKIEQKDLELLLSKISSQKTLTGHSDSVQGIVFSPKDTFIVTWSGKHNDRHALVYTRSSAGTPLYTIPNYGDRPVVVSPNGKYLISPFGVAYSTELPVFNINNGTIAYTLKYPSNVGVTSVVFSPDNKYVVTGSTDETVSIWNLHDGTLVRTLSGHSATTNGLAISPDSQSLVTWSFDKTAKIWNMSDGKLIQTLVPDDSSFVTSAAISPDGTYVVTASSSKLKPSGNEKAKIWNAHTGKLVHTLSGHTDLVRSIAISADGKYVVTSGQKEVKIWNLHTGTLLHTVMQKNLGFKPAMSPDSKYLVTGSKNALAEIWRLDDRTLAYTIPGNSQLLTSAAFSNDGKQLALGISDYKEDQYTVQVWDNIDVALKLSDMAHAKKLEGDKKDWPALRITFLLKLIEAIKNEQHLILDSSIQKDGKPGFLYGIYKTMFDKQLQKALAPFIRIEKIEPSFKKVKKK